MLSSVCELWLNFILMYAWFKTSIVFSSAQANLCRRNAPVAVPGNIFVTHTVVDFEWCLPEYE